MLVVYASRTGNVERFVDKLGVKGIKIYDNLIVEEPFVLATYTTGFGEVPKTVLNFLIRNNKYLVGVMASGNKNWGNNFAKSADIISSMYNVPIVGKFELSGFHDEVENIRKGLNKLAAHIVK